jgi:hypothetical protein
MKTILTLVALLMAAPALAKDCTESTIREAIKAKKRFDFVEEGCSDKVVYISKGIGLGGGVTIDGRGKLKLSWKGPGSQCDEIPRGDDFATFFTTGSKNVIKNLTILLSPEGIQLSKGSDNVVDGVTFERICEDAITNGNKKSTSATGSIIRNSVFKNAPDKAIQCNGGSVTVQNSEFRNVERAIGACTYKADGANHGAKECPTVCHIKAYNNRVYGCDGGYAFRGAGYLQGKKQGTLTALNNTFYNCKVPLVAAQYGYIYAEDNVSQGGCEAVARTEQSGTGHVCENKGCNKPGQGSITTKCIAQDDVPSPSPTPSPQPPTSPGKRTEDYSAQGTGGTTQNLSVSERNKLACSRASDRALVNARQFCTGKVIGQKTDNCADTCRTTDGNTSCTATATVTCEY